MRSGNQSKPYRMSAAAVRQLSKPYRAHLAREFLIPNF